MSFNLRKCSRLLTTLVVTALCAVASAFVLAPSWTSGASFPSTMVRGAGVWFPANGRFYVMGGRTSDAAGSDLFFPAEYNPGSNSWAIKTASFPDNQNNNMIGAVLTEGGTPYIYCIGGSAAGAAVSTTAVRRYDPVADVMTVVTSDPWSGAPANTLGGGGAVFNNKLYIFGGFTINVAMSNQIWVFDPNAAAGTRWTLKAAVLPTQVGYVPVATIGNLIYIAGGSTYSAGVLTDSNGTYAYDPVADTLTAVASIPRITAETKAVNEGGQMCVLGGGRTAPNPSNEVDLYMPGPNTWSLGTPFVLARRNMAADVDPATGNIYMVGGYVAGVANDSMEIFVACGSLTNYCTAGTTTNGCTASIAGSGSPSASAGSGFTISISNVEGQKSGLIFYGINNTGFSPTPWGVGSSSYLCVKSPTQRTPTQNSGGTLNSCNGAFSLDWNAYIVANPGALGTPFLGGETVYAQGWFRDPPAPKTTNLSNALQFSVCP
jgi:N-acetylneuraminic acid mutarotase